MSATKPQKGREEDSKLSATGWEVVAIIAVCFILISPFIYNWRIGTTTNPPVSTVAKFAGTPSCKQCHQAAYKKWHGSDHDLAMAEATEKTVLGDFNNVVFTDPYSNKSSRFFKEKDKFLVETEGPDGNAGIFTISHTFGFYPLQQYLVPFPDGKLQCLTIAWDIEQRQWYRLPPYEIDGHTDWLHWTKGGQTWNGMCAECHSTRLQKEFDIQTESYSTSWFEINVGCEACHGPSSQHVDWAKRPALARPEIKDYGLSVSTNNLPTEEQIVICAPCHSRRYQLGDNDHTKSELLDLMVPTLLTEGLYYPDGQILDEVYVYGSFSQSKMYQHGVRCNDCHDPHSLKPHKEKNALCLQCHRASDYDTKDHHFHKMVFEGKPSEGYLCVKCHMPGRDYMGIDYRPDHSLRIPRPDLSKKLETPNGCSTMDCHGDKPLDWVVEHYTKWYGESRKPHYGEALAAGRAHQPEAAEQLTALIEDELLPSIVRATALTLLRNYPGPATSAVIEKAIQSNDPLMRHSALQIIEQPDEETILKIIAPKLYDPVKAVRLEAALTLAEVPLEKIRQDDHEALENSLEEYRRAMEYNADFAAQRYNLGNLERVLGNPDKARKYYLAAIGIDDQFFPAKVNLAMLYNGEGKNKEAELLLREVVDQEPQMYEIAYSLGLLLSEMEKYEDAAIYLGQAARGMVNYSRPQYNYGLALLKLKRWEEGANALKKAVLQDPTVNEYFVTLVNLYLNFRMNNEARALAEDVLKLVPDHATAKELLQVMK